MSHMPFIILVFGPENPVIKVFGPLEVSQLGLEGAQVSTCYICLEATTWTPKVCRIIAFMAIFRG